MSVGVRGSASMVAGVVGATLVDKVGVSVEIGLCVSSNIHGVACRGTSSNVGP